MSLRIYNTLKRQIHDFSPLEDLHVRMYVCGMTVYDLCHVGHARSMVAFDVVHRWLLASGFRVTFVRNITDIDDKIIRRALENNESIRNLTNRMIEALHEDADLLGVLRPTFEPRATEFVPQMLSMISTLEQKGLAYRSSNGDVNYSVRKFPAYGQLSGKSLDDLRAGERVEINSGKEDPLDPVLWKSAKPSEPEDAKWESPFGVGRPGWHIECSAMACALLGESFDIHGGGADLQFPHHETEIAQSEGATDQTFARFWMHNGFINIDNQKMSKSLGNFFTIRDVLKVFDAETIRFFIVRSHYRSPLNYSDAHLQDAKNGLRRLYATLASVQATNEIHKNLSIDWTNPYAARFKSAMDNDFGTPEAVAVLFDLANEINKLQASKSIANNQDVSKACSLLLSLGDCLGLLQGDAQQFLKTASGVDQFLRGDLAISAEEINDWIAQRAKAKAEKNFALADNIRKNLLDRGIVLKDSASGTNWETST